MHFLLPIFIAVSSFASEPRPEWVEQARQLIGERSGIRNEALKKLSEIFPNFDDLAPEIKGPHRHYALDVAVAMKFPGSVERLLENLENDRDGSTTLAVNALLDMDNHKAIGDRYIRHLQEHKLTEMPTPVIVGMVDFLTHMRRPFPDEIFAALLAHSRLEVQQAAALYFAVTNDKDKQKIVESPSAQLYPQVRAQLMMTYYENRQMDRAEAMCRGDQDPILQSACQGLQFNKPKPKQAKPKKDKRKAKP